MRIFKGLENIHAVIDSHDNEWRREQGEPEVTPFVPVRERIEKIERKGKGGRDPNRFLEGTKKNSEPELEIIEPIKQEGTQHSWLYNEIKKAVEDAVGDSKRKTKVVAIIVPVIQNGKEFENLPVDESVTLPPVQEEIPEENSAMPFEITVDEEEPDELIVIEQKVEEIPAEPLPEPEPEIEEEHHDFDLIPEAQEHPDDELAEAFNTMHEKLNESSEIIENENENESEGENENESESENELEADNGAEIEGSFPETEIHAEEADFLAEKYSEELEDEDLTDIQEAEETMNFDEFPVLKEDENTANSVEEFIEEVTPEEKRDELPANPPSIEDFDDDEVFEESLENIETSELENEEAELENDGTDEEVIKLD